MNRPYKSLLTLSFLLALASQGVSQPLSIDESCPSLKITVFVHDYALVSSRTATKARNVAAGILGQAGLETEWRWPALSESDAASVPPLGPTGLALRILPPTMGPALPVNRRTFGVAFPFSQRGFGVASILFQRVDQLASRKVISRGLILGHVMAHETGAWEEATDWHRISAWRKEKVAEYLTKGQSVYVEGRLQTRSWDD